jgi:SAM-dependent methyltransferase
MDLRSLVDTGELRRRRYQRVAREVGLRPTDRILELGCGAGHRSIAAWNRHNEIVGVDRLDPAQITVAQPNFVYQQGDASDLAMFGDRSFDVVVSIGMLEHIGPSERLALVIHEARRVASRYAFVVPHRYAFIEPHYQLPLFPIWPEHIKDMVRRRSRRRGSVIWPTAAEGRVLFGHDPTLRVLDHWYGPILMFRILVGGPTVAPG